MTYYHQEHCCQQELESYGKFHEALYALGNLTHDLQTKNFVSSPAFIDTFDGLVIKMMKAESGDELETTHQVFQQLLLKEKKDGRIDEAICQALIEPIDALKAQRERYLPQAFSKQSHIKKNTWVMGGCALISTALALSIVGAPFIPAVVLGGAVLAYGIKDQANDLGEHFQEKSSQKLATMHHQNFDEFKSKLENKSITKNHKLNIEAYIKAPKEPHLVKLETQKNNKQQQIKKHLKLAAKCLGTAGLGLAAVALLAVFPPIGIPVVAGIAIGIVSAVVVAGSAVEVVLNHQVAKKDYQSLVIEQSKHKDNLSYNLSKAFINSTQKSQIKQIEQQEIEQQKLNNKPELSHKLNNQSAMVSNTKLEQDINTFEETDSDSSLSTEKMFEELDSVISHHQTMPDHETHQQPIEKTIKPPESNEEDEDGEGIIDEEEEEENFLQP